MCAQAYIYVMSASPAYDKTNTAKLTHTSPDIVHQCYNHTEQQLAMIFSYTEQQTKHGRLHTGCFENQSIRIPSPYRIFRHSHDSEWC